QLELLADHLPADPAPPAVPFHDLGIGDAIPGLRAALPPDPVMLPLARQPDESMTVVRRPGAVLPGPLAGLRAEPLARPVPVRRIFRDVFTLAQFADPGQGRDGSSLLVMAVTT